MFKIFKTNTDLKPNSQCNISDCPICAEGRLFTDDLYSKEVPKIETLSTYVDRDFDRRSPLYESIYLNRPTQAEVEDIKRRLVQRSAETIIKNAIATQFPAREAQRGKFKIGNLTFKDISSEQYREYYEGEDLLLRIEFPVGLHVSENGHRVFNEAGESFYIFCENFSHIKFKVKKGQPYFVF